MNIQIRQQIYLINGFQSFYKETGVYTFLYVTESLPDKSQYEGYNSYGDMLCESLFTEEGNLLIIYVAETNYYSFVTGYDARAVVDRKALDIISDKVDSYWDTGDLAKAFGYRLSNGGEAIMKLEAK